MNNSKTNFIDYVKIYSKSGNGGKGSAHFFRSRIQPKGGPDGGDGGRGGHVVLRGNSHLWTLLHLKYTKHIKAGHGGDGSKNTSTGANGKDAFIEVPLGTIVKDAESNKFLFEITKDKEEVVLLRGGMGGKGNVHFKNSVRQSPRYAQPGKNGVEASTILELKVLADVGLVGFPNAGKSTLLSRLSAAKPKIADYEFTTLVPNLGIVDYRGSQSFIMADIPGIIDGASEGRGLGHRFLRHIERNTCLLFLVAVDSDDIMKEYATLLLELQKYNPDLLDKDKLLVLTKSDMIDAELEEEISQMISIDHIFISSVSNHGLDKLKDSIWTLLINKND
ncbi:MAG: GTPase ObgE [Flavobacteriales bacterium]|jgi:GTP-binding protein|nr:GTPase ObgE [Flavobacteriales bacterium]|tara:strand:+ start:575 stop:1576 length:1002 start_codon:yes stop_codon:yes gene_type:complete